MQPETPGRELRWNGLTWRPLGRGQGCNWGSWVGWGGRNGANSVPEVEGHRGGARLTRLISSSLFSCRALSNPNAFPPAGDKEAARKRGDLPGHAPPPGARARPRAQVEPPGRPARDRAAHRRRLPWNLLLIATDMVRTTRLPQAPDSAATAPDEGEGRAPGPEFRRRVAAGPRGGGSAMHSTFQHCES